MSPSLTVLLFPFLCVSFHHSYSKYSLFLFSASLTCSLSIPLFIVSFPSLLHCPPPFLCPFYKVLPHRISSLHARPAVTLSVQSHSNQHKTPRLRRAPFLLFSPHVHSPTYIPSFPWTKPAYSSEAVYLEPHSNRALSRNSLYTLTRCMQHKTSV